MSGKKYYKIFNIIPVILLLVLLFFGVFFRFANLGDKIFWVDEVATALRVSGYTIPEVTNDLLQQDIIDRNTLYSYQKITSDRTFNDSFNALIKSPEHAPFYFLLTRLWMQLWGSSITAMRSLSVCLSLLVFPCLYWLCQELFDKPTVSWLAVMLMTVSPFYVAYAQEARPYSLWTVTILLMSASFLRAIRHNSRQSWLLYCFSLILGFYTSLFSLYIGFFQGLYLLVIPLFRKSKIIKNYLLYSLIAYLAFSPWILIIIHNISLLHENTSWMRIDFAISNIIAVFIGTVLLIFGDLPISQDSDPIQIAIVLIVIIIFIMIVGLLSSRKNYFNWQNPSFTFPFVFIISTSTISLSNFIYLDFVTIIGALVALCILSLSTYSIYYLITKTNRQQWLFILSLILSIPLPLILTDIINQGQSSATPRYLIPLQLGIQIAVAYTLGSNITINKRQNFWKITTVMFLSLGVFSCTRNLNLSPVYQKTRNINNPAIAKVINHSNSALVIVESDNAIDALSLAYSLSPQVKYKVMSPEAKLNKYFPDFTDLYVLKPSAKLKHKLKQDPKINFQQVYKPHVYSAEEISLDLWLIKRYIHPN